MLFAVLVQPGLAGDCPASDYERIEKRVSDAASCDASMQLLMACQLGSSGDVALSLIVIKKCESDFLALLNGRQRRRYLDKIGACGNEFANQTGTLYQSIRAICAAEVAHGYAADAAKAKRR